MSPTSPSKPNGQDSPHSGNSTSINNSPHQPGPPQPQQPSVPLQSTDFPPLTASAAVQEKRAPVATGAWAASKPVLSPQLNGNISIPQCLRGQDTGNDYRGKVCFFLSRVYVTTDLCLLIAAWRTLHPKTCQTASTSHRNQ